MKNVGTLRAGLTAWIMALLTAIGLQACGGGGGGAGDSSTSASGTDTQTLSSGIRIAAVAGEYVAPQQLTVPYPASGKSFVTLDNTSTLLDVSYTLSDAGVVLSVRLIRDLKEGSSLEYITLK